MLQLYSRIYTAPIISELDEAECGTCDGCIVDFSEIKVVALEVAEKALLLSSKKILLLEAVIQWTDSLTIRSSDDLVDAEELVRLESILGNAHTLMGMPVQTVAGESIGTITDYLFDDIGGSITKIHIGSTGLLATDTDRIISRDVIVRITPQAVIIREDVIPLSEASEQKGSEVPTLQPEPSFMTGNDV